MLYPISDVFFNHRENFTDEHLCGILRTKKLRPGVEAKRGGFLTSRLLRIPAWG